MKRLMIGLAMVPAILISSGAVAQDPEKLPKSERQPLANADEIEPTEDMWFYLQELQRYDDPQIAIRRKEELKAKQRRQRLAAMKWYGYSPGRPPANPMPTMGHHSPMWVGNGSDPYLWIGNAYLTTTVQVEVAKDGETTLKR
ncbi:MAG: hypothetical protein R6U98_07325 [Pirellulaceae bacterium]